MDEATLGYYERNAELLASRYLQADVSYLHAILKRWLKPRQRVLEIGCGCGREAAFMAQIGCNVLATDASSNMLSNVPDDWRRTAAYECEAFPLSDDNRLLNHRFDAVVAVAMLMHVPDGELAEFLCQVRTLLVEEGLFICSVCLSHPHEDGDQRLFVDREPLKLQFLLERIGMRMITMTSCLDSRQIEWVTQVYTTSQVPEPRALCRILHILNGEKHSTTYKMAFVRALCDISLEHPGCAKRDDKGGIILPLGLVVERWIRYYWPLVESSHALPEMHTGPFRRKLAFRDSLKRLIQTCRPDVLEDFIQSYNGNRLSAHQQVALREAAMRIAEATIEGPISHIGGSGRRMGQLFTYRKQSVQGSCSNRQDLISGFGSLRVPHDIWQEIGVSVHWIREASILRWAQLSRKFAASGVSLEEVVQILRLESSEPASSSLTGSVEPGRERHMKSIDACTASRHSDTDDTYERTVATSMVSARAARTVSSDDELIQEPPQPNNRASESMSYTDCVQNGTVAEHSWPEVREPLQDTQHQDYRLLTLASILRLNVHQVRILQEIKIEELYLTPGLVAQLKDAGASEMGQLLNLPVSILIERGRIRKARLRHVCIRLSQAAAQHHVNLMVPGEDEWSAVVHDGPSPQPSESAIDTSFGSTVLGQAIVETEDRLQVRFSCDDPAAPNVVEPEPPLDACTVKDYLEGSRSRLAQEGAVLISTNRDITAYEGSAKEPRPATLAGTLGMTSGDVARLDDVPLEALELSPGVRRALAHANLLTVGQLVAHPVSLLLDLKGVGRTRLLYICQALARVGRLRAITIRIPNPQAWNESLNKALLNLPHMAHAETAAKSVNPIAPSADISVLQMTTSVESLLRQSGLTTVGALVDAAISDVEVVPGIGLRRAREIVSQVQAYLAEQDWYQQLRLRREAYVASALRLLSSSIAKHHARYVRGGFSASYNLPQKVRASLQTILEIDCETLADCAQNLNTINHRLTYGLSALSDEHLNNMAFAARFLSDFFEPRSIGTEIDELLSHLAPRQRSIILGRLVGEKRTSLQEIGSREGLTRERVRQLQKKAEESLRLRTPSSPLFSSALALAMLDPMPSSLSFETWTDVLRQECVLTDSQEARTLLAIAERIAVPPLIVSKAALNTLETGVSQKLSAARPEVIKRAKASCRQSGVIRLESLSFDDLTEEEIEHLLRGSGYRPVEPGWWCLPHSTSVLIRTATKMLHFCGPLHVADIRYGARKSLRRAGFPSPPSSIIRSLLLQHGGFRVDGDVVSLAPCYDARVSITNAERLFLSLAKTGGPIVTFEAVNEALQAAGYSVATVSSLLKYSPLIRKVSYALYARVAANYDYVDVTNARASLHRYPSSCTLIPRSDGVLELRVTVTPRNLLNGTVSMGRAHDRLDGEWELTGGKEPKKLAIRRGFIIGLRDELDHIGAISGDRIAIEFDMYVRQVSIRKVGSSD